MDLEKKVKSSVMIHESVWQEIRILAIRERKEIGELVEEIFRERLARGYQPQSQTQSAKDQLSILDRIKEDPEIMKKLKHELPSAVLRNIERGIFESREVKLDPTNLQKIKNIIETKKTTPRH